MTPLATLKQLEEEAIYVLREVAGQFERAMILFSGGKDSILVTRLAIQAFAPSRIPFALLHVDTGHNFPETLTFRDEFAKTHGLTLVVREVQATIDAGRAKEETGSNPSRNAIQSVTLMDAIHELKLDCAIGGARRDEEKARAKERFFSHRNGSGRWEPRNQRPEIGRHFNGAKAKDEHFRVFPISNWTELDVWSYLALNEVPLPSLYFIHQREVFDRDGMLSAVTPYSLPREDQPTRWESVRFRTVGDATCTGATLSTAGTIEEVIGELKLTRTSERSGRGDDKRSATAMEDRKREGYF